MTSTSGQLAKGTEILGYRVERTIGRGGMGVVYLAEQVVLDRLVALKLLAPELAGDEGFRERFLRESRLAASLDHPNIVPVFDAGEVEGRLYIAMRYVEGADLGRLLEVAGTLEPARAIAVLAPVADALDAAHARGLVHRDVKPSNVLLDQAERPYLADFGLARQTSEGGLVELSHFAASVAYVAPEQIEGEPIDARTDVYALGCVLFECLTGSAPFGGSTPLTMLWAHLNDPPPEASERNPALPERVDAVLERALAKDPADRQASCGELVAAAQEALGIAGARSRSRLLLALVVTGVPLLVVAAVLVFFLTSNDDGPARPSTEPTLTPSVDALQRIDPATNQLAATIGVGSNPNAVGVGAGHVWVGSLEDQAVLRIDPETNAVTGSVTMAGPSSIEATTGEVLVTNTDGTLTSIDPSTLAITNRENPGYRAVAVGEGATWTVGYEGLVRTNNQGHIVKTISEAGFSPFAVATGAGAVWVLDDTLRSLWRVDPRTDRVVKRIRLGFDPAGVGFGWDRVWVTNNGGDTLVEIDSETDRIRRTIPVGDGPIGVAIGERSVWVANYRDGTVSRVDPQRGTVVATTRVGRYPTAIAAGQNGVWVTVRSG